VAREVERRQGGGALHIMGKRFTEEAANGNTRLSQFTD
jgi:hypothetical protein